VVLGAFELLELDGRDLRRAPIEDRKATLAKLLRQPPDGIAFNEPIFCAPFLRKY
jgi:ATP-dependent DNA ligase